MNGKNSQRSKNPKDATAIVSYYAVQWLNEEEPSTYSTVPLKSFVDHQNPSDIILQETFRIKWGVKIYDALICFKGTYAECDQYIDSICNYSVDLQLKSNINKSKVRPLQETLQEKKEIEIRNLIKENEMLKSQMNELELSLLTQESNFVKKEENYENVISNLKQQLVNSKSVGEESLAKLLDVWKPEQLIDLSVFFFNSIGKSSDLTKLRLAQSLDENNEDDKLVVISGNHPKYMMPSCLRDELIGMHNQKNTDTEIYRALVNKLIPDTDSWADNNAVSMQESFPFLKACKDFIFTLRPGFTSSIAHKELGKLCNEARRKRKNFKRAEVTQTEREESIHSPSESNSPISIQEIVQSSQNKRAASLTMLLSDSEQRKKKTTERGETPLFMSPQRSQRPQNFNSASRKLFFPSDDEN